MKPRRAENPLAAVSGMSYIGHARVEDFMRGYR